MNVDATAIHLSPIKYLKQKTVEMLQYGRSESDIETYVHIYNNVLAELENKREMFDNETLNHAYNFLLNKFPKLNLQDYVRDFSKKKFLWFFKNTAVDKIAFFTLLEEVIFLCDKLITYIENPEWLDLAEATLKK